jgi:glycerol-3-phosphate dehydrogenase
MSRFASFLDRALKQRPAGLADKVIANLCRNYGTRYLDVLRTAEKKQLKPLCKHLPDIMAEVVYAVEKEMALSLNDVLFRRTGLCTLGNPGGDVIEAVANCMAKALKWNKARRLAEIDRSLAQFETVKE